MPSLMARSSVCVLGVVLLALVIAAIPAGRRPFWSSDEARVALLARDVLGHDGWLVAEIRGQPYLNKPQLFFWSVAAAALPFGRVTELTAAIPALVSSLVGVAGVIAVGRLLWGWQTGALAGLILVTTPLHFEMSHQVLPDVMLNAWLVWALYWFLRAERVGWRLGPLLAFYGCCTAGLLSKGPQALTALAAAGVAVAATEGAAGLRKLRPVLGIVLTLAVAIIAWLGPYQAQSHGGFEHRVLGGHYMTWYLLGPIVSRFAALAAPLPAFLPWTVLLAAAPFWWRQSPDRARRQVVLWTATLLVLTALSGTHRSRYMLPGFPGLALMTAELLTAKVTGRARWALRVALVACGALGVAIVVALTLTPLTGLVNNEDRAYMPGTGWELMAIIVLALAGGVALLRGARRDAPLAGAIGLALAMAGVLVIEGITYPVRYARSYDVRPLAAAAARNVPPDGTVIGYPDLRLSYDFYLERQVVEISDEATVRSRLAAARPEAFIMTAERWRALAPGADPAWQVLASATLRHRSMVVVGRSSR